MVIFGSLWPFPCLHHQVKLWLPFYTVITLDNSNCERNNSLGRSWLRSRVHLGLSCSELSSITRSIFFLAIETNTKTPSTSLQRSSTAVVFSHTLFFRAQQIVFKIKKIQYNGKLSLGSTLFTNCSQMCTYYFIHLHTNEPLYECASGSRCAGNSLSESVYRNCFHQLIFY